MPMRIHLTEECVECRRQKACIANASKDLTRFEGDFIRLVQYDSPTCQDIRKNRKKRR